MPIQGKGSLKNGILLQSGIGLPMGPDQARMKKIMSSLSLEVRRLKTLSNAWKHVKRNGLSSISNEIRDEVNRFDAKDIQNINRIQRELRNQEFQFLPQKGIEKLRPGKNPRPIVIAPIESRIVQRAILNVLQNNVQSVKDILQIPTSVGGIKGVENAIVQVTESVRKGARWYIRSDIQDFFANIPKSLVIDFLKNEIHDAEFLNLFEQAIKTVLENASLLGDNLNLFPLEDTGVAQGSALSPLIGNILLKEFDIQMNDRGITCIRYIDDFVILAPNKKKALSAFKAAKNLLTSLRLTAYAPSEDSDKAKFGEVENGFDFLGCEIKNQTVVPSEKSRKRLLTKIDRLLSASTISLRYPPKNKNRKIPQHGFGQTITKLSHTIKGWGDAYKFCQNKPLFDRLNKIIYQRVDKYQVKIDALQKKSTQKESKRILGVYSL